MRYILTFYLTILLSVIACGTMPVATDTYPKETPEPTQNIPHVTVEERHTTAPLNIRSKPCYGEPIIGTLKAGTPVTVYGFSVLCKGGLWTNIGEGWVNRRYLK